MSRYEKRRRQLLHAAPSGGELRMGLGLTVQQLCVNDDYGRCPPNPALHPQDRFYATWPTKEYNEPIYPTRGMRFEH